MDSKVVKHLVEEGETKLIREGEMDGDKVELHHSKQLGSYCVVIKDEDEIVQAFKYNVPKYHDARDDKTWKDVERMVNQMR